MMNFLANVVAIVIGRAIGYLLMLFVMNTEVAQKWLAKFSWKYTKNLMANTEKLMKEDEAA